MSQHRSRAGFTLIEILVALVLIGILAAFVVPGVVQQVGSADAPKVVNDLTSLRTAVTSFSANMNPALPGDVEDLVNLPVRSSSGSASNSDLTLAGVAYSSGQINRWNGQYIDALVPSHNAGVATGNAIATGFGAYIQQGFVCFNPNQSNVATAAVSACTRGTYVAASIVGLDQASFLRVNDLIDGDVANEGTTDKMRRGHLRYDGTIAYYLVTPFRG